MMGRNQKSSWPIWIANEYHELEDISGDLVRYTELAIMEGLKRQNLYILQDMLTLSFSRLSDLITVCRRAQLKKAEYMSLGNDHYRAPRWVVYALEDIQAMARRGLKWRQHVKDALKKHNFYIIRDACTDILEIARKIQGPEVLLAGPLPQSPASIEEEVLNLLRNEETRDETIRRLGLPSVKDRFLRLLSSE